VATPIAGVHRAIGFSPSIAIEATLGATLGALLP
jgi:hypothetical protein